MKIEYDNESDGMFIWFQKNIENEKNKIINEIWPKELKEHIGLLFDEDDKIIGIEILFASKYFKIDNLINNSD